MSDKTVEQKLEESFLSKIPKHIKLTKLKLIGAIPINDNYRVNGYYTLQQLLETPNKYLLSVYLYFEKGTYTFVEMYADFNDILMVNSVILDGFTVIDCTVEKGNMYNTNGKDLETAVITCYISKT